MKKNYLKLNNKNFSKIDYGFFTRNGGYSKNNYSSLNCSYSSKDKTNLVKKNISLSMQLLNIKNKKLKLLNQIHSNKVIEINKKNFTNKLKGDGLITKDKSISLAVLTADCTPVFLFDKKNTFICVLHIGWKGCLKNIAESSINKIKKINKNLKNIIVIIGPCLAKNNFEVNSEFKNNFIKTNNNFKKFFYRKNKDKDLFDMRGLIKFQFRACGISNVYNVNQDTYKNPSLFFSYRRSFHKNRLETGRMINIISFK
tara:strand:+ start:3579 stop:4346 length:768 start_codon:yes stop_codon:yes gene_type:complete